MTTAMPFPFTDMSSHFPACGLFSQAMYHLSFLPLHEFFQHTHILLRQRLFRHLQFLPQLLIFLPQSFRLLLGHRKLMVHRHVQDLTPGVCQACLLFQGTVDFFPHLRVLIKKPPGQACPLHQFLDADLLPVIHHADNLPSGLFDLCFAGLLIDRQHPVVFVHILPPIRPDIPGSSRTSDALPAAFHPQVPGCSFSDNISH